MYQVIARKFRPKSFSDFVGQEHVKRTLLNAITSERFPHAILLNGPRGTGKTSTARIIAKTILCQNRKDQNPCGQCQACQDIAEGRHLDVIEIDGASNNGVDHIRELRETIGYMPSSGSHKIYIIDEVHMLSTSAFNALLKTLEEPPAHVIFIFATTEVQKIPATILSRCQRFDFRNHSLPDIKDHLAYICREEGITFTEDALWVIAKQAKGSIRDSLTLLDQLIAYTNKNLNLEAVMSVLGLTDRHLLLTALSAIATNDSALMFNTIEQFKNSGYDPMIFAEEFLEVLRNSLLVKMEYHKLKSLEMSEGEIEELEKIVVHLQMEEIHLLFDVVLSGVQRLNFSSDSHLSLEMMMFKLLGLPRLTQSVSVSAQSVNSPTKPKVIAPQKAQVEAPPTLEKPVETTAPKQTNPPSIEVPNEAVPVGKTWEEFVHAVKQVNGFLGALLEHTSIGYQDENVVRLDLPDKMSFLLDKLTEEKNIERTENFLKNFWNDNRKVEVILLGKNQSQESLSPKAREEIERMNKAKKEADSVEAHPLVQATEKIFKDNITKVSITNSQPTQNH